jgi:Flp pilus assembly protein TadG
MVVVMLLFTSLAVDWGHVQLTKIELQRAADAAARYAVAGLSTSVTTAQTNAVTAAAANTADGQSVTLSTSTDIDFGTWDPSSHTFTVLTGTARSSATAIRITARRIAANNNGVKLIFAQVLGRRTYDLTAVSIATRGHIVTENVAGAACPWLAGMPTGSTVAATGGNTTPAIAPTNSPTLVSGISMTVGQHLSFRDPTGVTSYSGSGNYGPDGETDWIVHQAAANGINTTGAPIQALMGIFLDNTQPSSSAQAASLDFSTDDSRNFTTLSPKLKQVFFIGDGLDDSGNLQQFVVPTGATRLYIGIMDENGWWWDNVGTLSITALDSKITMVK